MARHRTEADMFPLIEAYLREGVTQREFCARHGIGKPTFSYWVSKYRNTNRSGGAFVEIASAPRASVEIVFPSGATVRLLEPVSPEFIASLVRAA
jgi:transposase-like protein